MFELRSTLRSLAATPIPAAGVLVTVALGLRVNVAMVSLVNRALFAPPAGVRDPSTVVTRSFIRDAPHGAHPAVKTG